MKNNKFTLIYIGNKLQSLGKTPTSIDTLSPQLEEMCSVISSSNKLNIFYRMLDMIWTVFINRKKADAVLIDTYSTSNFYFACIIAFLAKLLKLKYYPYLHGGNLPQRLKQSPYLSKFIFNNSEKNIAPSGYLQSEFKKMGYAVEFIPNNIDIDNYPFIDRKNISPKLLFVRAFEKTYNPTMAIKVIKLLHDEGIKASLCMVGPDKDGSMKTCQDLVNEYALQEYVKFTGKLPKQEWIGLSKKYDIFINPTHFDNQPVSVIEAMALGLPIVSTNVGGIPYLIEHEKTGLLVDDNDVQAMKSAIKRYLNDPDLVSSISQSAKTVAQDYAWSNVMLNWKSLLGVK